MTKRLLLLTALVAMLAIASAPIATATATVSEVFPGNDVCEGTKIDPVEAGQYDLLGGGYIVITLNGDKTFNFDTEGTALVSAITVKGGPNYHTYFFEPPVTMYDDLHAPFKDVATGQLYGLSHLCILSEKKDDTPPDEK